MSLRRQLNPVRPTIRELEAISRRGDTPLEPVVIELTDAGYIVLGSEQAVAFGEARAAILRCLADREWHPEKDFYVDEKDRRTTRRALDALLDEKVVDRSERSRVNEPYAYRLWPDSGAVGSSVGQRIEVAQRTDAPPLKLSIAWSDVGSGAA